MRESALNVRPGARAWHRPRLARSTHALAPAPQPSFHAQDSEAAFVWRVRNIPYPADVYEFSVDAERQQIVLRTTNRKYFKRFDIPCLKRMGIPLDVTRLRHKHEHNTLVIQVRAPRRCAPSELTAAGGAGLCPGTTQYIKPDEVRKAERQARESAAAAPAREGDVDCKQQ